MGSLCYIAQTSVTSWVEVYTCRALASSEDGVSENVLQVEVLRTHYRAMRPRTDNDLCSRPE